MFRSLKLVGTSLPVRVSKGMDWTLFKFPSPLNLDTGSTSTAFWIGVQASANSGVVPVVGYVGTKQSCPFTMRNVPQTTSIAPPDTIQFDRKAFVDGDILVLGFHSAVSRVLLETFLTNAWLRLRSNENAYEKFIKMGGRRK